MASTSSSFGLAQQQLQQGQSLGTQTRSLPKNYLSSRLQSLTSLPSESQVTLLESIVSDYKARLTSLRTRAADRPDLDLTQALNSVQDDIDLLTQRISSLNSALAAYAKHKSVLSKATDSYNSAIAAESSTRLALTQATAAREALAAEQVTAAASLASATATLVSAVEAHDNAAIALASATDARDSALLSFTQANANLQTTQALKDQTLIELTQARDAVTQAENFFNARYAEYQDMLDRLAVAQQSASDTSAALTAAQTALDQAQQALAAAQENYDTNLLVDPAAGQVEAPAPGLRVDIYNQLSSSRPVRDPNSYHFCKTEVLTQINNNWGGGGIEGCGSDFVMLHYTGYLTPTENVTYLMNSADDGFYMELDGVTVINDWRLKGCGGGWYPVNLQAGHSYKLDAWFYEWGGGACSTLYYQTPTNWAVAPAAWFTQSQPVPMIHDPALKPALDAAQASYDQALASYTTANANYQTASEQVNAIMSTYNDYANTVNNAGYAWQDAARNLDAAVQSDQAASLELSGAQAAAVQSQATLDTATQTLDQATSDLAAAASTHDKATSDLAAATTNKVNIDASLSAALTNVDVLATQLASSQDQTSRTQQSVAEAQVDVTTTETLVNSTYKSAQDVSPDFAAIETQLATPVPVTEGSKEIPVDLSATNLMSVDLTAVDPTQLTTAQAEQLVSAALETFQTAEQGSPEYTQALEALYLAAEQDDITVDPALAAVPVLGAAVQGLADAVNFLGNAGADMSPQVRKESKKIVVTAVVAAGAAVQAAAGAATSAAASSASSASSGAGSIRRKIK